MVVVGVVAADVVVWVVASGGSVCEIVVALEVDDDDGNNAVPTN
jgi:hypothetical protein